MKTGIIEGTWEEETEGLSWGDDGSPFVLEAILNGVEFADLADTFRWTTDLEGVWGKNSTWAAWGMALMWWAHLKSPGEPINLIAHSHGGQVAAYALANGLMVDTLVTVATPVRGDMKKLWERGAPNVRRWVHIHTGDKDFMQWAGSLMDGEFSFSRNMPPPAENLYEPGNTHSGLLDPDLWTERGWWDFVKQIPA